MTDPLHLIFVHSSDELYGSDRMLLEMVKAASADVDVEVWLPTDLPHHPRAPLCEELMARGVRVRHLDLPIVRRAYQNPRGIARLLLRSSRLVGALRAARPDAVYCTTSPTFLCAPLARLTGVPEIIGHFQEIWSPGDRRLLGTPARACHRLLAISEAVRDSLPPALQRRTVVVANGTPAPTRVISLEGRTGELRYLVASRWNGWKGHRTLLRAWDQANAPGQLVVLGGPPPSGESVDVNALVATLQRPESVSIVGEVSDPAEYIEAGDVIIMPSDRPEPFGLVAIEAFARARPVIATSAGGLVDIVTPHKDGWLFPPGDVTALANVLSTLTRDIVTGAGQKARDTYENRFTVEHFGAQWRAAVIADRRPVGRRGRTPRTSARK